VPNPLSALTETCDFALFARLSDNHRFTSLLLKNECLGREPLVELFSGDLAWFDRVNP
jgi:hypothetical protein